MIELWGRGTTRPAVERHVDPEAEIVFATPDGGLMGAMGGPFRGAEGLYAGWRRVDGHVGGDGNDGSTS